MDRTATLIVRNTVFNGLGRFWGLSINLLLTPYIISKLGVEKYGVWVIASVILSYFTTFDMGIGTALVKYIAEHNAKNNKQELLSITSIGIILYVFISILLCCLLLLATNYLLILLKVPPYLSSEAKILFNGMVILIGLSSLGSIYRSILLGLQRMDIINKIIVIVTSLNAIGIWVALRLGYGLIGLLIVTFIVNGINVIFLMISSRKLIGRLIDLHLLKLRLLKELLFFGLKIQLSSFATIIVGQLNKLLISHFTALASVSYYDVASKIATTSRDLPIVLISAIVPAASELNAVNDNQKVVSLYERTIKYLILLSLPLMVFVAIFGSLLIHAWLGPGFDQSAVLLTILLVGYFAHLLTGPGTTICRGIGKPEYETGYTLLLTLMSIVFGIIFTQKFGLLGAAWSSTGSLVLSSTLFVLLFQSRVLKVSVISTIRRIYLPIIVSTMFAAIISILLGHLLSLSISLSKPLIIIDIIIAGIGYSLVYFFFIWRMGILGKSEAVIISEFLTIIGFHSLNDKLKRMFL